MRSSVHTNHHMEFSSVFTILFLLIVSSPNPATSQPQPGPRNDPYNNYGRLSPAMAVIVVILIAVLFFMGFFSIYFRHCSGIRDPAGVSPADGGARSRATINPAARGLDASILETFPTFVYSDVKSQKIGKGELECAICLNEFEDDETLRFLPKCDHVFHPHCIGAWLEAHVTCPVCRSNLAEQVVEGESIEPGGTEPDVELQQVVVNPEPVVTPPVPEQLVTNERLPGVSMDLKRVRFSRSHTTGHSVVAPGECTERFTLRLPEDVRKRIIREWKLNQTNGSFRRGKSIDRARAKSDRWLFRKTPSFLWRNRDDGSIKLGGGNGGSVRGGGGVVNSPGDSVRVDRWAFIRNASFLWRNSSVNVPRGGVNKDGEGTSVKSTGSTSGSVRLPV